jgi:hypothetical protein
MLAYSCLQAHSNLAIEKTSPRCVTQDAQEQARGAMGRMATGGKDERLREHRIGHFRFQACGGYGCDGWVVFGTVFIPIRRDGYRIPIRRDGYRRNGGKADLEG